MASTLNGTAVTMNTPLGSSRAPVRSRMMASALPSAAPVTEPDEADGESEDEEEPAQRPRGETETRHHREVLAFFGGHHGHVAEQIQGRHHQHEPDRDEDHDLLQGEGGEEGTVEFLKTRHPKR